MTFVVRHIAGGDHVCLELTGEIVRPELEKARQEVNRELVYNNCRKLLVDGSNAESKVDVLDDFEFTIAHRSQLPSGLRLALLVRPEDREHFEFVENVARNRGVNMFVFLDKALALAWLSES